MTMNKIPDSEFVERSETVEQWYLSFSVVCPFCKAVLTKETKLTQPYVIERVTEVEGHALVNAVRDRMRDHLDTRKQYLSPSSSCPVYRD